MLSDKEISEVIQRDVQKWAITDKQFLQDVGHAVAKAQEQATAKEILERLLGEDLLEVGRKAVEDELVKWRDNRLSTFNRGSGLVIRERDGRDSYIIRFGIKVALKVGIEKIWQQLLKDYEVK